MIDTALNYQSASNRTAVALLQRAALVMQERRPSAKVEHAAGSLALIVIRMATEGAPDVADELERVAMLLRA